MRRISATLALAALLVACDPVVKSPPAVVPPVEVAVAPDAGTIVLPSSWSHISFHPGMHVVLGLAASTRRELTDSAHPPSNTGNKLVHLETASLRPDDAFIEVWVSYPPPVFGGVDLEPLPAKVASCLEPSDDVLGEPLFECLAEGADGALYEINYWAGPEVSAATRSELAKAVASLNLIAARGPNSQTDSLDGKWILASGRGPNGPIPLVPDSPITLSIEGGRIGGDSPCNDYGGRIKVDGDSFDLRAFNSTLIGCSGKIGQAEKRYTAALGAADAIRCDGHRLELTGPSVELAFRRPGTGGSIP